MQQYFSMAFYLEEYWGAYPGPALQVARSVQASPGLGGRLSQSRKDLRTTGIQPRGRSRPDSLGPTTPRSRDRRLSRAKICSTGSPCSSRTHTTKDGSSATAEIARATSQQ